MAWRVASFCPRGVSAFSLLLAFGCSVDENYPREDPAAQPTVQAMRFRVTQHGLDAITGSLPGLLSSSCSSSNPDASCGLDDPENPSQVRFYVGTPTSPVSFDYSLIGMTLAGTLRSGGDFAAGEGYGAGTYYRSSIGLDLANLAQNLKIRLVNTPEDGGGIEFVLGCENPGSSSCDATTKVQGSLDLVSMLRIGEGADYACYFRDAAGSVSIEVRSLHLIVRPRIAPGADGRPQLVIDNGDVEVDSFDVDFPGIEVGSELTDPACLDGGDTSECPSNCSTISALVGGTSQFLGWLVGSVLGETIGATLARVVAQQLSGTVLEASGKLAVGELLSGIDWRATPVGYLITTSTSPSVTGSSGNLGLNVDLDLGFAVTHGACVPSLAAPDWELPAAPEPGSTVMAPNPVTGVLEESPYGAAVMIGDSTMNRAFYEMWNSGSLCLHVTADTISSLTGGSFVPTLGTFALFARGLDVLGDGDTPVDIALVPQSPPTVIFGSGAGTGAERLSHLRTTWKGMRIELYPLADNSLARAFAFSFDLQLNVSIEPRNDGAVQLFVDKVDIQNLAEVYNELGIDFDLQGIKDLVSLFMPALLNGKPIDIEMSSAALGIPAVPKLRALGLAGFEGRYLGAFVELCTPADVANPANELCYEEVSKASLRPSLSVAVEKASGTGDVSGWPVSVRVKSDLEDSSELEVAFRADGLGPFYSFRPLLGGLLTIDHPALAWPGTHRIELVARKRGALWQWSAPVLMSVRMDRLPPRLSGTRGQGGLALALADDLSPAEAIEVRAVIVGPGGERVLDYAPRSFVPAAPGDTVTVSARDEAGLESAAVLFAPTATAAASDLVPANSVGTDGGCAAAAPAGLPALLLSLAALARRMRRRSV